MPFQQVPQQVVNLVEKIYQNPTTQNEKDLAGAYLELATRFNRLEFFLSEFFTKSAFETSMDMNGFIKKMGPINPLK